MWRVDHQPLGRVAGQQVELPVETTWHSSKRQAELREGRLLRAGHERVVAWFDAAEYDGAVSS